MRKIKWRPIKLITLMAGSVLIQMLLFGSAVAGAQSQPLNGAAQDATGFTSLVSHQAAAPEEGTFRGFYGEVAAGGANITGNVADISLNLLYSDEQEKLTFTESQWGPNYELDLPAGTAKSDLADFLAPGSQVAVFAQLVDGEWTAVQLMPVPDAPTASKYRASREFGSRLRYIHHCYVEGRNPRPPACSQGASAYTGRCGDGLS